MKLTPKAPGLDTKQMDQAVTVALDALCKLVARLDRRDPYTSTGTHIAVELLARSGRGARNLSGDELLGFEKAVDSYFERLRAR